MTCLQRSSKKSEYATGLISLNFARNECFTASINISQTYTSSAFCTSNEKIYISNAEVINTNI